MMTLSDFTPYIRDRFRLADAILFTGAGFSRDLRNIANEQMPLGRDLKRILWPICFPSDSYDENASLQDLFAYARSRNRNALIQVLQQHLTIDSNSIPEVYRDLISLPWHRVYTLNVDNFPEVMERRYGLPRRFDVLSATSRTSRPTSRDPAGHVEYVHLNGAVSQPPEDITFSTTQYAERLSRQDPVYNQCAADVLSRAVFFVGTPLDSVLNF